MKLSLLTEKLSYSGTFTDADVTAVTDDSRKVCKGCVFVCIEGKRFDGHTVAAQALSQGAAAVITARDLGLQNQLVVADTRAAYTHLCAAIAGNPQQKLKIIGVTGTNGKTTTCFILKDILECAGHKTGLIGTVKNMVGKAEYPAALTTPDANELFGLFAQMVEAGCEYCVMEVSSQALDQQRVNGIHFCAGIFTNLTRDHLDYHGDFDNYRAAKKKLFEQCELAVVNIDDEASQYMLEGLPCRCVTFSASSDSCDYSAKNIRIKASGVKYEIVGNNVIGRIRFAVPGMFSVYNSMGAAVCAIELGFDFDGVLEALSRCAGVPGRMEVVPTATDYTVIIDYAHSPDGLENLLECVSQVAQGRIITVFGCGGDRDKTKRPLMGEIASRLSDVAVVTSDNPRSEAPDAIIADILTGIKDGCKAQITVKTERREAINHALDIACAGDVVVLAGKGHETYQILAQGKIHFDEREAVMQHLAGQD